MIGKENLQKSLGIMIIFMLIAAIFIQGKTSLTDEDVSVKDENALYKVLRHNEEPSEDILQSDTPNEGDETDLYEFNVMEDLEEQLLEEEQIIIEEEPEDSLKMDLEFNSDNDGEDVFYIDIDEIVEEMNGTGEYVFSHEQDKENKTIEENKTISSEAKSDSIDNDILKPKTIMDDSGRVSIETNFKEGEDIEIFKEENVVEDGIIWKKKVKVYSEEHFDRPLRVYVDIKEGEFSNFELSWIGEDNILVDVLADETFGLELHDTDGNGFYDRISWLVPHLSEQNFEITIQFDLNSGSDEIGLGIIDAPTGTITGQERLAFDFNVTYNALPALLCDFSLLDSYGQAVVNNSEITIINQSISPVNESLINDVYLWYFGCWDDINSSIESKNLTGEFEVNIDYSPNISFNIKNSSINLGDNAIFYINISTIQENSVIWYNLSFGDGTSKIDMKVNSKSFVSQESYNYSQSGTYVTKLSVWIVDQEYPEKSETIVVNEPTNSQEFDVDLISPTNNVKIDEDIVNFTYSASHDENIKNCTLSLYFYNNSNFANLVYSGLKEINKQSAVVSEDLTDFDSGKYDWDVECIDTSGVKEKSNLRSFEMELNKSKSYLVSDSKYESEIKQVEELLDRINDFLIELESYDPEARESVEDLGFVDGLNIEKKKLLQMKTTLQTNFGLADEQKKIMRLNEIMDDIERISDIVPLEVLVSDNSEFTKNTLNSKIEDIISDYMEAKNIKLKGSALNRLTEINSELQSSVKISTKVRHVSIEYLSKNEDLTLITRDIDFKKVSEKILEVIPTDIVSDTMEINIFSDHSIVKEGLVEIETGNLKKNKLIYTIEGHVDLKQIESFDTLAFNERVIDSSGGGLISAFAVLEDGVGGKGFWFYFSWLLFLVAISGFFIFGFKKTKFKKLQGSSELIELNRLIEEGKSSLEYNFIAGAKNNYRKISALYSILDAESKQAIYGRIKKLRTEIDKKDVSTFVQEYMVAISQGRKEDAMLLYGKIKILYGRIPDKYRLKIHEKIGPTLGTLYPSNDIFRGCRNNM
ncbi:hypothetical protein COU60_02785 [Candidatus Pacearchaeota archaeon CG10_big_fil_rev_8_21_14_0_10_34_76]|nr:MAG: hypothetical protein COU60_02785 [Candidatus Pacearchaeota archaeon CG10_big_fil_rev_8_21_14_0_10_34_76]